MLVSTRARFFLHKVVIKLKGSGSKLAANGENDDGIKVATALIAVASETRLEETGVAA